MRKSEEPSRNWLKLNVVHNLEVGTPKIIIWIQWSA
jgi:hypothetical protein